MALAEPQDRLATTKRNASAPGNVFGVTSDQVQPVESIVNQDNAGAKQADEVPIVDTATSCFTDTVNPDSCPESPHIADDPPPTDRSSGPESYTLSSE